MTYTFTYSIEGYKTVEVDADSSEEAQAKANQIIEQTDCGELENIDWEQIEE